MVGGKRTPLYETYKQTGAKLIDFGGWDLPVQFSSIKHEHEAVRTKAGLFDVSHMGEVLVTGKDSEAYLQYMMTNDLSNINVGEALYTAMCYEDGGTVDDLLVYKKGESEFLLVVNASNTDKDFKWLREHVNEDRDVKLTNCSSEIAQLALQGPLAESILQQVTSEPLNQMKGFTFKDNILVNGVPSLVSRTGYTAEDGFEIYCPSDQAEVIWKKLLDIGQEAGLVPCGLGARDTLRFEGKLALYGQELSRTISPIEAGIGFAVKVNKSVPFIGQESLKKQKDEGPERKLVGIEMIDKGIPRSHYAVFVDEEQVGEVTTGTQSPTLKKNLGLALIKSEFARLDQQVEIDIRGKKRLAIVIKAPFYKKGSK
ncbi:glycine cleavage system aminomethyltransferase GcvT [Terrilactibacillus laevilacticus]|uniref:Aminomethyltransferase n=1 Tax=Terrilactibacillus laevilacticus TaxID=1380157 RepID=A0ABW5PTR7_9BACI|nr:glycine cleavage system aminomethyltransferase GcvT [Terrilactibacillus laevilacticus]